MNKRYRAGDLIGHRKDGRPIYLIGGGSEDHVEQETDGNAGQDEQGQTQDDDTTTEDLLGGNDDGDDGDDTGEQQVTMSADEIRRMIADEANRVADRRINQALQTSKRRKQTDTTQQQPDTSSDADVREARLVYREYVADEVKFTSTEERTVGANLARSIVATALSTGSDVEAAGQQAAREVAEQVKALRATHQRQVIDQLKKRGVLPKDYQARPSRQVRKADAGTTGSPVETSDPSLNAQYGESIAKRLFPRKEEANQ